MGHIYSKFQNKNIPYAKVGRRVFKSLFDAENFCAEHNLDVNFAIEYKDDSELKDKVQMIAQYQKAILSECLDRLNKRFKELSWEIEREKDALQSAHPLDRRYTKERLNTAIDKHTAIYEAYVIINDMKNDLETVTNWHD